MNETVIEICAEIAQLQCDLASTDYVCNKIVEGVATREDYADILTQRQVWRARINELQTQLEQMKEGI